MIDTFEQFAYTTEIEFFFSKTGARGHFRHQIKLLKHLLQYINERINHFPLFQHARMQVIFKKKTNQKTTS